MNSRLYGSFIMTDQRKRTVISEEDKVIGRNLRRLRGLARMNQTGLASEVDISFQQIQKYENGKNRVSAIMLLKLSKALNVEVTAFYFGLIKASNRQLDIHKIDRDMLQLVGVLNKKENRKEVINILLNLLSDV